VPYCPLRTRTGKAIRAVSDNPDLASTTGINTDRIILIVWVVGAGLAGLGGILLGLEHEGRWDVGVILLRLMFAAITLGGLGNPFGALVGGIVIGLFVELWTWVLPSVIELKNIGALLALILILLIRPQGILGRKERVGEAMDWSLIFSNALYTAISVNAIAYALIAQGLNVHFGYTGLLTFGQAAFAAAGAYAVAIPISRYGWSFWATIPVLLTAAIVLALLLGIPTLRLRADYLSIVTIAASEIVRISLNSVRFTWLTGGNDGLQKFTADLRSVNPIGPH